jgi:hypothetical protein
MERSNRHQCHHHTVAIMSHSHFWHRTAAALTACLWLAGCASQPPKPARRVVKTAPIPAPTPNTDVYAYPTKNQSQEQQQRDRFECHNWAVKQTNFDPSAASVPAPMRVRVVPEPSSGASTATGAITGAVVGAAIARPGDAGIGAVAGGIVGAAIGSANSEAREDRATRINYAAERRQYAALERQAANYRRAISACLEARDYSVR